MVLAKIDIKRPTSFHLDLNEHRVTLSDERYPTFGFGKSREFNYLNFDNNYVIQESNRPGLYFELTFSLSRKVFVQNRIVYNVLDMLGDVGGLFEILQIGLSVFCGFYARNLFLISQVTSFFQISRTPTQSAPS